MMIRIGIRLNSRLLKAMVAGSERLPPALTERM
jgi:hypothetical protein